MQFYQIKTENLSKHVRTYAFLESIIDSNHFLTKLKPINLGSTNFIFFQLSSDFYAPL